MGGRASSRTIAAGAVYAEADSNPTVAAEGAAKTQPS